MDATGRALFTEDFWGWFEIRSGGKEYVTSLIGTGN